MRPVVHRRAEDHYDQLPALAADLVGHKVDVIAVMGGTSAALAAKSATPTIPIVFAGGDPIEDGLVASLAHPDGNLTGVSLMTIELMSKRLELLCELVPRAKVITLLVNPTSTQTQHVIRDMQEPVHTKGVQLSILKASTEGEIDGAFAALGNLHADALIIGGDPLFTVQRGQLVALATRYAVPVIDRWPEFPAAGGLISYGPSLTAAYRQVGIYAGKILNGAKPADLPVKQPTIFELVVNLKTVKTLGLTVPPSIFARADEVIE
ncbi:MAG: ABC transporter substrate-binding protein [Stellaceae bacterium]